MFKTYKGKKVNSISQPRSVTCHIGSRGVTCHPTQVTLSPLTRQAGTRFTCRGGMEGWVDLGDLLHDAEIVYLPADGHPSRKVG